MTNAELRMSVQCTRKCTFRNNIFYISAFFNLLGDELMLVTLRRRRSDVLPGLHVHAPYVVVDPSLLEERFACDQDNRETGSEYLDIASTNVVGIRKK